MLSRNYPNAALPGLGLWVHRFAQAALPFARPVVVAPVPLAPPFRMPGLPDYAAVPSRTTLDGVPVHHPRFIGGPGHLLHRFDSRFLHPAVRSTVRRLHEEAPFDLIHAHFVFPEGLVAVRLGQELGIPVVTTEHAIWRPWFDVYPAVRRQVVAALPGVRTVTVVSEAVRASVNDVAPDTPCELLPNVVDDVFAPSAAPESFDPDGLLFVGVVRQVKGLDVLVRALPALVARRPELTLTVVGDPFYRRYRRDEEAVRQLVRDLGLAAHVRFVGHQTPEQVAERMRAAAVVVVPSRRESFSAVAAEALACGTPVVATRCGGPEDFVGPEVGRLVAVDAPAALAGAVLDVLERRDSFERRRLSSYARSRFSAAAATERLCDVYAFSREPVKAAAP